MAKRAESPQLREAFQRHLEETQQHVDRLRGIGEDLEVKLGGKKCRAMEGIIEEGAEVLEADGEGPVIDAALVAAAQRAEHYEITAYGTARTLAKHLGHEEAAMELQRTLEEESATDEKLTQISVDELLPAMGQGMQGGARARMEEGAGEEADAGGTGRS